MAGKRKLNTATKLDSVLNSPAGPLKTNMPHEKAFNTQREIVRLLDVKLNYKNKRVVTQFIRIIPDSLIDEAKANAPKNIKEYVLENVHKVPVNNIALSYQKINEKLKTGIELKDSEIQQLKYPQHYTKYDVRQEGVFVGKGVCFLNFKGLDNNLHSQFNEFVEAVNENGRALKDNDLVEDPQIIRNGSSYVLLFGHHRICYLIYQYGTNYNYHFILCSNVKDQDLRIFRENNTSKSETGYEKVLSYYFSSREALSNAGVPTDTIDEAVSKNQNIENKSGERVLVSNFLIESIPISKGYYYKLKPFLADIKLIDIVAEVNIRMSIRDITTALSEIKHALQALGQNPDDQAMLREKFKLKLQTMVTPLQSESVVKEKSNVEKSRDKLSLSVPSDDSVIKRLLFTDVREWSKTDIDRYDLSNKKGIKAYFNALLKEIDEINDL